MRVIFNAVVLLMAVVSVQADPITYLSDTRDVSVWIQADSALAQAPHAGATNQPSAPFNDTHLSSSCNVGWQAVNGWTAAPSTGSAAQDVSYGPDQITVVNSLAVNVGGDPFGFHFPTPASGIVRAESMFEVRFFVASLTDFSYSFDFSPSSTLTTAMLTLASDNHGTQQLFSTSGVPVAGMLAPDTYTLSGAFSSLASGAQAGNDFSSITMNFTPAPEPTAGALLVMGVVVVRISRRKTAPRR